MTISIAEIPLPKKDPQLSKKVVELILYGLSDHSEVDEKDIQADVRKKYSELDDRTTVAAVEDNGDVLAVGALRDMRDGSGVIEDVVTICERRGEGLGTGVISEIEKIARERGISKLSLYPTLTSEGFYTGCGYKDSGLAFTKQL